MTQRRDDNRHQLTVGVVHNKEETFPRSPRLTTVWLGMQTGLFRRPKERGNDRNATRRLEAQWRMAIGLEAPAQRFGFSGHESFTCRYGWLKKAVEAAACDEELFAKEEAIVRLGVGKNMVRSIRHWGLAYQLLQPAGRNGVEVSKWGDLLLGHWDPFLEDIGSLWLLHWLLVNNPSRAGTWFFSFFIFPQVEFTKVELLRSLVTYVNRQERAVKEVTLSRDVDCFLRTYVPSRGRTAGMLPEDAFDCPLAELRLLSSSGDDERHQFNVGPKSTLPMEVFGFALLSYLRTLNRSILAVHECLYGVGSPGQAFKLDENSVVMYLESLQQVTRGELELDDTAGLKQIYLRREVTPERLLEAYYQERVS